MRQNQLAGSAPFVGRNGGSPGQGGQNGVVADREEIDEQRVKADGEHPDHRLGQRVGLDQVAPLRAIARNHRRAQRHAAHEQRQHQRLCIGRVAQEQAQVMRPDRLIDQTGKARQRENREQQRSVGNWF